MIAFVLLTPAALLLATTPPAPIVAVIPAAAIVEPAAPTFDPAVPPAWWTEKMRQPCTRTGDRVVC